MYRNTFLLKTIWNKYNKQILVVCLLMMLVSWPAYYLSKNFLLVDIFNVPVAPANETVSDDDSNIRVHDNFDINQQNKFQDLIIDRIEKSNDEIVIAMYSFNISEIKDALKEAVNRGVKVKIVYEYANSKAFEEFINDARSSLDIKYIGVNKGEENYHMHHKYAVFDKKYLLTGSWNWSYMQQELDPNILLEITNEEIVEAYYSEFYRIWNGNYGRKKFFDWSYAPWMKKIIFNNSVVEIWFSPGRFRHSIQDRLIQIIKESKESIYVAMTIMDSRSIANELIKKAEEGVKVVMIVDRQTAEKIDSEYPYIKRMVTEKGLDNIFYLYLGGTEPDPQSGIYSIFHHHNMVIDNSVVVTGTANWTYGGFFLNDEDFLIIRDSKISNSFIDIYLKYLGGKAAQVF
jgi:phosphatidylserine/phosphatidylglycerophosphate/cardiolipin synthase-like enzyme